MKKQLITLGLLSLLTLFSLTAYGQNDVSVNIRKGPSKSASKARNIALSNMATSIGVGLGTIAITDNEKFETVASALTVYGLVVGPSTGNFYAKDFKRGFLGLAARTTGAILMVDATREIFGDTFANRLKIDDKEVSLTDTKILIGEALVIGSIVYNILTIQKSVKEFNESAISLGFNATTVNHKSAPVLTASFNF